MANKRQSKKKGKTKASKRVRPLDPLREQLQVLVAEANKRANKLIDNGYESRALEEAKRTLSPSRRAENDTLFKSNLRDKRQINREFARVNAFLNDFTSLSRGAEMYKKTISNAASLFGGQWVEKTGERYNTDVVSAEDAARVFDIYNRVIEQGGGWERVVGFFRDPNTKIAFGSDVLIAQIYDMVVQNDVTSHVFSDEEIMTRAMMLVNQAEKQYDKMAMLQRTNKDYGKIGSDDDQARREFYYWRREVSKGNTTSNWADWKKGRWL